MPLACGKPLVFCERCLIHVDLPADTAAMAASGRDTGKTRIVSGGEQLHKGTPRFFLIIAGKRANVKVCVFFARVGGKMPKKY
jgi:hypothetical protein